jgi:hypothetical protein
VSLTIGGGVRPNYPGPILFLLGMAVFGLAAYNS